ncbi:MAG: TIGR04086 family membrane protein [Clostridiaceae bacterium]|nr:TIGR04086 family membrane protein [Clostridiaceae bacterium]
MENKSRYFYIGKGVLGSFFLTLVLILILGIVSTFIDVTASLRAACFIVITSLSVIYGSIYSTRKIQKKGWIIGILVALLYILIIYLVAIISGSRGLAINSMDLFMILLAMLVGSLSGMLGINL